MEIPIDRRQGQEHYGLIDNREVQADDGSNERPALAGSDGHRLIQPQYQ